MNKDVFDYLKDSTTIDWSFYDKWTTVSEGNFLWQKDELIDMIYMVFRSKAGAYLGGATGEASIGPIEGSTNNEYIVYQSGNSIVKVKGGSFNINCSGHRTDASGGNIHSRHQFIDVSTHEHGHYLFGGGHHTYCHMTAGAGWEFSLSPWEVVKLGYVQQKFVDYYNPTHYLYDYSSRYGSAGTTGEVLQVPISADGEEFFMIANRRKVSEWDRRISGDTLSDGGYQALKNINPEYGKGIYIYHITDGYKGATGNNKSMDLECADGLWNWENAGFTRPPIWDPNNTDNPVFKRISPSYNNDNFFPSQTLYNRDEMSFVYGKTIWFSPGSRDLFNPLRRGTTSLYTNEDDYWFSLPVYGDRWDAWDVGYNEIFSPYSSPNTKDSTNSYTGIFIWNYYNSGNGPSDAAYLKIYKAGEGGLSEDSILHLTPPSRPMGIVVDYYLEGENYMRPIITWNHNEEPDMLRTDYKKRYKIWKATNLSMNLVPVDYSLLVTLDIDTENAPSYIDTSVIAIGSAWPGMGQQTEYPVRYTVQAVDKYGDSSVRSDFGSAIGLRNCSICAEERLHLESAEIPKNYELYHNYPNPFNPETKIKFDIPYDNFVRIKVYDILGKEIFTLVNEFKNAGRYNVSFNGTNYSSGVYYYKIKAGNFEQVRKMIILK